LKNSAAAGRRKIKNAQRARDFGTALRASVQDFAYLSAAGWVLAW
jgi:hypothetical protein